MNNFFSTTESTPVSGRIFIGVGTVFTGTIHAPQEAIVHGELKGNLSAPHVVIGELGVISGSVDADTLEVHGVVTQDVLSRKNLHAFKTAVIKGDLQYVEIQIERGAKIEGALHQAT